MISLQIASKYLKFNGAISTNPGLHKGIGEINCRKIYGNKFDKLINNVNEFSTDLSEWLVTEGYGKVFGRPGLSLKEREISIVAILASLKFRDQLYSHIKGAIRFKNTFQEVKFVIEFLEFSGGKNVVNFGINVLNNVRK